MRKGRQSSKFSDDTDSCLDLNVSNPKEIVIGFKKNKMNTTNSIVHGENVEMSVLTNIWPPGLTSTQNQSLKGHKEVIYCAR